MMAGESRDGSRAPGPRGEGAHLGEVVNGVVGAQDVDGRVREGLERPHEAHGGRLGREVLVLGFVYVASR